MESGTWETLFKNILSIGIGWIIYLLKVANFVDTPFLIWLTAIDNVSRSFYRFGDNLPSTTASDCTYPDAILDFLFHRLFSELTDHKLFCQHQIQNTKSRHLSKISTFGLTFTSLIAFDHQFLTSAFLLPNSVSVCFAVLLNRSVLMHQTDDS